MKPVDDGSDNVGGVGASNPTPVASSGSKKSKVGLYIAIAVVVGIVIYFIAK